MRTSRCLTTSCATHVACNDHIAQIVAGKIAAHRPLARYAITLPIKISRRYRINNATIIIFPYSNVIYYISFVLVIIVFNKAELNFFTLI